MHRAWPFVRLSVCLSPKYKYAIFSKTKQFRAIVHGLYLRPTGSRTRPFQRTHYWTHKIPDGLDPPSWKSTWRHFFCWGWSDLDKISHTGAEWHVDWGDVVKIEIRCRIPIRRTFGRTPWHVTPEPPATLQGAATARVQQYVIPEPRITCHLVNSLSWF